MPYRLLRAFLAVVFTGRRLDLWFRPLSPALPLMLPGYSGGSTGRFGRPLTTALPRARSLPASPLWTVGMVRSSGCFRLSRSPAAGCLVCPFFTGGAACFSGYSGCGVSSFPGLRVFGVWVPGFWFWVFGVWFFPGFPVSSFLVPPFGIFAVLFSPRPHSCSRLPIPDHPLSEAR